MNRYQVKIKWIRGDDYPLLMTFKDKATKVPTDITDWDMTLTIKSSISDSDDDAKVQITAGAGKDQEHSDPTNGQSIILVDHEITKDLEGKYVFDVQIQKPESMVKTLIKGIIEFVEDVTITTE